MKRDNNSIELEGTSEQVQCSSAVHNFYNTIATRFNIGLNVVVYSSRSLKNCFKLCIHVHCACSAVLEKKSPS